MPSPPLATDGPPGATAHQGRRDRKKQATRQALRNAALELVAERGFKQVTVEDIAEAADVATRTFFNYFPSKESAVIGADPERIEEVLASLLARPVEEPALEALRWVAVEYAAAIDDEIDDLGEGREAWFRRLTIARQDPDLLGAYVGHITGLERSLVSALAQRLGKDSAHDPYPALVTAAVFAVTRVAALYWSANGGVGSLARLVGAAIDSLAQGLVNEDTFSVASVPPAPPLRQVAPAPLVVALPASATSLVPSPTSLAPSPASPAPSPTSPASVVASVAPSPTSPASVVASPASVASPVSVAPVPFVPSIPFIAPVPFIAPLPGGRPVPALPFVAPAALGAEKPSPTDAPA